MACTLKEDDDDDDDDDSASDEDLAPLGPTGDKYNYSNDVHKTLFHKINFQ
jgi:hypothetical protein